MDSRRVSHALTYPCMSTTSGTRVDTGSASGTTARNCLPLGNTTRCRPVGRLLVHRCAAHGTNAATSSSSGPKAAQVFLCRCGLCWFIMETDMVVCVRTTIAVYALVFVRACARGVLCVCLRCCLHPEVHAFLRYRADCKLHRGGGTRNILF